MIIFGMIVFCLCSFLLFNMNEKNLQSEKIEAVIMYKDNNKMVIEDDKHVLYLMDNIDEKIGTRILLEYANINNNIIDKVISYEVIKEVGNILPKLGNDNGIFSDYYTMAYNKLNSMSINEKISQLLLVKYHDNLENSISKYPFGGMILDKDFFNNKTKDNIINFTNKTQNKVKIPLELMKKVESMHQLAAIINYQTVSFDHQVKYIKLVDYL